jgi:hypothetical protein
MGWYWVFCRIFRRWAAVDYRVERKVVAIEQPAEDGVVRSNPANRHLGSGGPEVIVRFAKDNQ